MLHKKLTFFLLCFIITQTLHTMEPDKKTPRRSLSRGKTVTGPSSSNTEVSFKEPTTTDLNLYMLTAHSGRLQKSKLPRSKSHDPDSSKPSNTFINFFSKSDSKTSLSTTQHQTNSSKKIPPTENSLIDIVRSGEFNMIERSVNNATHNLNQKNQFGMTALHYATLNASESKDTRIINLLLRNPQTDSSLANNHGSTASQLIEGNDFLPEIRRTLFARLTLDLETNKAVNEITMNEDISNICITKATTLIKNRIRTTELAQGGSDLPKEALLPEYATDEFIFTMIQHRMPRVRIQLDDLAQKEAYGILLEKPVTTENKISLIKESVTTIKQTINKNNILPHYATDEFIFKIIEHHIEHPKLISKLSFSEMIPQKISTQEITTDSHIKK